MLRSAEEAIRIKRICKSCDQYRKVIDQCKACGCIITLKTRLKESSCPIGKW